MASQGDASSQEKPVWACIKAGSGCIATLTNGSGMFLQRDRTTPTRMESEGDSPRASIPTVVTAIKIKRNWMGITKQLALATQSLRPTMILVDPIQAKVD